MAVIPADVSVGEAADFLTLHPVMSYLPEVSRFRGIVIRMFFQEHGARLSQPPPPR